MIKTVLAQITLFILSTTFGFSQEISFDSLNQYYKYELNESKTITYEILKEKVEHFSTTQISEFSQFQKSVQLIALINKNKEDVLGIELILKLIPQVKAAPKFRAFLYYKLAQIYQKLEEPVQSLECYLKASSIIENLESNSYLAHIYYNIAIINLAGWNNEISIQYAQKGLKTLSRIENYSRFDSASLLGLHEVKGVAYRRTSKLEKSLQSIEKAVELSAAMNDSVRLAVNNGNKATIYYEKGEYDLAIPLLEKDFETSINAKEYTSGLNALIYLSWIYINTNDINSLLQTFEKMQEIEEKELVSNPSTRAEYFKIAAKVSEIEGDTAKANHYLRDYIQQDMIRDSLNLSNDIASLHERHLMEQEIGKLELLQNTNQLQASHLKLRTTLLIIIAIALIVVLWYVFTLRNKNKKIDKLNEILETKVSERTIRLMEINKELDTYLYRASHDIRKPIRTLLGLNNIAQINTDTEQMKQLFSKVHSTAMSMDKMLFKLQMAYELNNSSHTISEIDIEELTSECINDMSLEIQESQANIRVNISNRAKTVQANKALLRIALDNLLENALLYQSEDSNEIEIFTDIGNHFLYIHVKDNGLGIPKNYFNELFKPYFKISNKTQGSGLGLFLAHKAMLFLEGEIAVSSTVNEGSQFTLKIPINPK